MKTLAGDGFAANELIDADDVVAYVVQIALDGAENLLICRLGLQRLPEWSTT